MSHSNPSRTAPPSRPLVLGTALLLALVVWLAPRLPAAHAEEPRAPAAATAAPAAPVAPEQPASTAPANAGKDAAGVTATIRIEADTPAAAAEADAGSGKGVGITSHGRKVRVMGLESDRDYDSFSELVHQEPWLGALIFWCVTLVFVVPLLMVVALVWYKVRKTRMLNETMLKLAERGVVPPGEAMEAIALGKPGAAMGTGAPAGALYEQARQVRRRVAWSDLRKGIVLGGIGAALTLASIINDGDANGFGLVLLFVGVGYVVLWWFEDRKAPAPNGTPPGPTPGA
jgi:hypothetical protein